MKGKETETEKEIYTQEKQRSRSISMKAENTKQTKGEQAETATERAKTEIKERWVGGEMRRREKQRVKGTDRCKNEEGTEDKSGEPGELGQEQTTVRTRC